MDAATEKLIRSDPNAFKEAKEYMLDHFGSNYTITPEEGYAVMLHLCPIEVRVDDKKNRMLQRFLKAQDEFYHRFWCEEIAPTMTVEEFIKFTTIMNIDLGATFFLGLGKYLQKHFHTESAVSKL